MSNLLAPSRPIALRLISLLSNSDFALRSATNRTEAEAARRRQDWPQQLIYPPLKAGRKLVPGRAPIAIALPNPVIPSSRALSSAIPRSRVFQVHHPCQLFS